MMNLTNLKSITAIHPSTSIKALLLTVVVSTIATANAQTQAETDALGPPSLGEQTKGKPAIEEVTPQQAQAIDPTQTVDNEKAKPTSAFDATFGTTKVTEHKRESGQVYLIELENSLGSKQYLYENDSDGKIGSTVEDRESITEIPKWKLGSW